jgi:hypothetical protein
VVRPPAPDPDPAPIPLLPMDVRLLDAPPVLALVRLDGRRASRDVRRAFLRRVPRRFSAVVHLVPPGRPGTPGGERERDPLGAAGPSLLPRPGHVGFGTVDVDAGELDALTGVGVPLRRLARIGLGDAPAVDPLCSLTHVRAPDGDALAIRLSHAAGDGISLLRMLDGITAELDDATAAGASDGERSPGAGSRADARRQTDPGLGATDHAPHLGNASALVARPDARWLSVLPLSAAAHDEIAAVRAARPELSATVCRMAVVARRLGPLVRPAAEGLRIRMPIDLRFRGLGIPPDAVGNHWLDALAVLDGPMAVVPDAVDVATTIRSVLRDRVAELTPADVDHRPDQSLRLVREVPGEPIRRGVDLVHSSLPVPAWPGVRAVHVLGSALLGLVDVRGTGRVDLVTERPLPAGVHEL